jgi:hypothetical protein
MSLQQPILRISATGNTEEETLNKIELQQKEITKDFYPRKIKWYPQATYGNFAVGYCITREYTVMDENFSAHNLTEFQQDAILNCVRDMLWIANVYNDHNFKPEIVTEKAKAISKSFECETLDELNQLLQALKFKLSSTPSCSLRGNLITLLNTYSVETASNTPDYILADYLLGALELYECTIKERSKASNIISK